jgi:hypothetical protein
MEERAAAFGFVSGDRGGKQTVVANNDTVSERQQEFVPERCPGAICDEQPIR